MQLIDLIADLACNACGYPARIGVADKLAWIAGSTEAVEDRGFGLAIRVVSKNQRVVGCINCEADVQEAVIRCICAASLPEPVPAVGVERDLNHRSTDRACRWQKRDIPVVTVWPIISTQRLLIAIRAGVAEVTTAGHSYIVLD